jgi:hypothetical protein
MPRSVVSPIYKSVPVLRSKFRKMSDETIQQHVKELEDLATAHGGYVPRYKWLNAHGYFSAYRCMKVYPAAFAHLKQEGEKSFDIDHAHNATPEILPPERAILAPANYKSIAEYDISGARFSPTELRISEGLDEKSWQQLGRALAHICQSTYWWIGDFILYGKRHYGTRVTYTLAQQATSYSKNALYLCVRVAKKFPPERRAAALTFYHHALLVQYAPELSDKLLAEGAEYGYTARQLKKMADEATGVPEKEVAWKALSVVLPVADYQALHGHCNGMKETKGMGYRRRVEWLASKIVDEWLREKERTENDGTTLAGDEVSQ